MNIIYFNRKIKLFLCFSMIVVLAYAQRTNRNDSLITNQQKEYKLLDYSFYSRPQISATSSVVALSGDTLAKYPTTNLVEALKGKIPSGLFSTTSYTPGEISTSSTIRGMGVSTMVDGMSFSLSDLDPMEIESVTITNGVTDRAVLGSSSKFNLINVNSRRGKVGENKFKVSIESGTKIIQQLPTWVSGYDNAMLYNTASVNDGLEPKYNNDFLASLKSGANTLRYPNEDYFGQLFNRTGSYRRLGVSYTGGSDRTKYFVFLGYTNEGDGLLKLQDKNINRIRVRGNIDTKISDIITLSVDFIGRYAQQNTPPLEDNIFSVTSTYPSYAFPVVAFNDAGNKQYGRTLDFAQNPIAQQTLLGRRESSGQFSQNNIKLNFDLDGITKGLSFTTGFNYSISNSVGYERKNGYTFKLYEPVYKTDILGSDSLTFVSYGQDKVALSTRLTSESITQNFVAFANLEYKIIKNKSSLYMNLIDYFRFYNPKDKGMVSTKNDLSLITRYGYDNRYFADVTLTYSQDNFLPEKNRRKIFPAFGAAWLINKESFLSDVKWVDLLKLRFNYGIIGSSDLSDYYISQTRYVVPGSIPFGPASGPVNYNAVNLSLVGNESLDWVLNKQAELGIDASLLNNKIGLNMSVYQYTIDGIIDTDLSPKIVGVFNKYTNIGKNKYQGIDFGISHNNRIGDFSYELGVNFGLKRSEIVKDNRIVYQNSWMNRIGNPTDGIYGFEAVRLYASTSDIDNSEKQFLGNVSPGDIKYKDIDGNQKVEPLFDQKMIGHSSPNYIYGLNLNLAYKNLSLYIQGSGIADVDINVSGNTYFKPVLRNKYSTYVAERVANNNYPRLSTFTNPNNAALSTYWLMDGSYFKINNVELAYTLIPQSRISKVIKNVKIFVRGTNLLSFSNIPELDPEAISAGVSDYPSMKTITAGLNIGF